MMNNDEGRPQIPGLLTELIEQDRWKHPGDEVIQELIPFLREPVDFLPQENLGWIESQCWIADDAELSTVFRMVRGSKSDQEIQLPWLDIEQAIFIAENRIPGDDIAIFLDYRSDKADPRVVASNWWNESGESGCKWVEVAETFSRFVQMLCL